MRNKRQHKRFEKRYEIEFTANGISYRGTSEDFSLNGLFIRTKSPLPPDTVLDMVIHLPNGMTSKIKGKVVRSPETPLGKGAGQKQTSFQKGVGVEIREKDASYLEFIKSLFVGF
jgi:hypothetical protein